MIHWEKIKSDDDLKKAAHEEFKARYRHMHASKHGGWALDYQYYLGRPWVTWGKATDGGNRIYAYRQDSTRARISVNKCRPFISRVGNALYQKNPRVSHVPVSPRLDDVAAASVCDKFNEFMWRENKIPSKWKQVALYTPLFGTSFWTTEWDSKWGEEFAFELTEELEKVLEQGRNTVKAEDTWNTWQKLYDLAGFAPNTPGEKWVEFQFGKPRDRVELPHVVFLNFGATPEKSTWTDFMIAKMVPMAWFERHYPGKKVAGTQLTGEYHFLSPLAGLGAKDRSGATQEQEWSLLLEWHVGRCKKYPTGKVLRFGGESQVLLEPPIRADFGDIADTLHAIYYIPDPMSAYGISLMSELRNSQVEYNVAISEQATWSEYLKGKHIGPRGIGLPDRLTTDPHEILDYAIEPLLGTNMRPLENIAPPRPPDFLEHRVQRALKNMEDAANYHAPTLLSGEQKNVRAGLDFALRMEEDERGRWSVTENKIELEKSTTQSRLKLVHKNWPHKLKLRIVGENNQVSVLDFNASDIASGIDVQAIEGGESALSQALQEERVQRNLQMGVYGPVNPEHPGYALTMANVVRALGIKEHSFPYRDASQAEDKAREETRAILVEGQKRPVYSWQNHGVHRLIHGVEAEDQRYRDVEPEAKQMLEAHLGEHVKWDPTTIEGQNAQLQEQIEAAGKENAQLKEEVELKTIEAGIRDQHAAEAAGGLPEPPT